MFDKLKDDIINMFTSRLTLLAILFIFLGGVLAYRCFDLQIVHGQEYLDKFILQTEKTRDITSTRGKIYDRNGVVLAYDELAYSVKIEDVYESGSRKNKPLNATIYKLIKMIELNGDSVITDFSIVLNEDNEFEFDVTGTKLNRFLADVYGYAKIEKLSDEEKNSTALDVINYLAGLKRFAIGEYEIPGDSKSTFIPGKGYTNDELLKMVTVRYAMNLTSYRKYIGTKVATDISEETVAVIMENINELDGVSIIEDTVRRYNDSFYFSHILGYTGKISQEELDELNAESERYSINDVVGKLGIEATMETTLQGIKGYEKVCVDNTGRVISILDRKDAKAGNDVYLTIDSELQKTAYNVLEQMLAGILLEKIVNQKEYKPAENATSSDIKIPIYDVYYAVINNSVIDIRRFDDDNAQETEKAVYESYLGYKEKTYNKLLEELNSKKTVYNRLNLEYKNYESYIVNLLKNQGILMSSAIDNNDPIQIKWKTDETISLNEYLNYCISANWIDVSRLNMDSKYSDSTEIYSNLCDKILELVDNNLEFQKMIYRFMIKNDIISGGQICKIICEQNAIEVPIDEEEMLFANKISAYNFMINRIKNMELTPAQLALDPCNGTMVVSDVNNGDVLALVTYPGYDNNKMANYVDATYYAKLTTDKSNPQINYATQYKAAPGSTYKMVSTVAGLEEGVIDLKSRVNCTGQFELVTPSPWCWNHWGHGSLNVTQAITNSCNYFFYDLGYKLATRNGFYNANEGLTTLAYYADLFGLSEKSGVEIDETSPQISTELPIPSAIGQGSNSFTAVGLNRYVAAIANGGDVYNLTLLDSVKDAEGNVLIEYNSELRNHIDINVVEWNAMRLGMRQVVESKVYFNDLAIKVAGKTGTAEQSKSRPSHALFVAYAPYDQPEIAITTRIPFGYTSDYAAQATKRILGYYYGIIEQEEVVTGVADTPDAGVSNNEI